MRLPSERSLFLAATAVVAVHLLTVAAWRALAVVAVAAVAVPRLPATLRAAADTRAPATFPREYARRVVGLFARALLRPEAPA